MMRCEPGEILALDKTGNDACQFPEWFYASARPLIRGAGEGRQFHSLRLPGAFVPLTDVTAPILNVEVHRLAACLKSRHLIAAGRGSENIDAIEFARRQRNRLA